MSVVNVEVPDKSQGDKKLYRALELSNGLRAMLVSDPEVNDRKSTGSQESDGVSPGSSIPSTFSDESRRLACCACNISVGSFSAPKKYKGLAHLLAHMIFKGSEKYPENALEANIIFHYTYTADENTCFCFIMEEQNLDKTLEIFMNLIKAPLMPIDGMIRERSVVSSEVLQRQYGDAGRVKQLIDTMATENYPHSTFTCESFKSLAENVNDVELHKELHDFHRKHYGSNRMTVCIQSNLPLDELQKIVLRHCSDIPRSLEEAMDASKFNYRNAFQEHFFRDVMYVKPQTEYCLLELTWVLPSMHGYYRVKPCELMSYLLGYEGVGSLCAYLRNRVWAERFNVGHNSNFVFAQFVMSMALTYEGIQHLDEVMSATFAWIRMLCSSNIPLSTYKELQQMADTNFRFQSDYPQLFYVSQIAGDLRTFPFKDVLTGCDLFFEYNEEIVRMVQHHLNEFRFQILFLLEAPHILYDQKEHCYDTQFTQKPMPEKWKTMWTNPQPHAELQFPASNPFVPTDFSIHWVKAGKPHIPRRPKALIQNEMCELWFRQDDTFLLPEGMIIMNLLTPLMQQSAKDYLTGLVFVDLVNFELRKLMHHPKAARLFYDLYGFKTGLELKVHGYNEKLPLLCEMLVNMIKKVEVNPAQVNDSRMIFQGNFYSAAIAPFDLNHDLLNMVVQQKGWTANEKYEASKTITPQDVERFRDTFHRQMYIQALIQGNFTEQQALQITENVLNTFKSGIFENYADMQNRTVRLPHGEFFLRVKSFRDCGISVLRNYHQLGPSSLTMMVMLELLNVICNEEFDGEFCNKEEMCYFATINFETINNIGGYILDTTSKEDQFPIDIVEKQVENFHWTVHSIVSQLSEEKYMKLRQDLMRNLSSTIYSLQDESLENWAEIDSREYIFNRTALKMNALAAIEKKDVLEFLELYMKTNMRKLSVQVIGTSHPKESEESRKSERNGETLNLEFIGDPRNPSHIMNIAEFKKNLYVYPHISIDTK